MTMAQGSIQASRADELEEAGAAYHGKPQDVVANEELIPPTIRYQLLFGSSGNHSTIAVYSLNLDSATLSVESFHTAFTSPPKEDEDKDKHEDEDARSEEWSICEGPYANQPMEAIHDASQIVQDDPLPRPGLDLPPSRVQIPKTCSRPPVSSHVKEAVILDTVHRIHKRITKNISRKLTKRKEH